MTLPGGQHNQGNTTEHGVVKASVFWRGGGGYWPSGSMINYSV